MNKTAKNSIIYFVGTVTMGIMGLVSTMILTRFLPQKVYAMNGLLATFHTIVTMLVSLGYDSAYMRFYYEHPYSQKRYIAECLKVPAILFGLVTLVLIEPGQHIIEYIFGIKLSALVIFLMIIYFLFSFVHRFSQLTARMEGYAGNYVLSNIVGKSGFILVLVPLYLLFSEVPFDKVIVSHAIAAILAMLINLLIYKKIWNKRNEKHTIVNNTDMLAYGFPITINCIIVLLIPMAEKIIIRELAGWEVLSVFTAASIFQTVMLMISNTVTSIWNPMVFKYCEDEGRLKPIMHRFGQMGVVISVLGVTACILLRRWLVLILDSAYYEVYIIAPVILLTGCFNLLFVIYSVGINIKKKTWHLIIAPVFQFILSVIMCFLLIPKYGLVGVGLAILVSTGVNRFYTIIVGLRLYDTGENETKTIIVIIASIAAAVISLFRTSLLDDIAVSVALFVFAIIVMNKDLLTIINVFTEMVLKRKKHEFTSGEKS